MATSIDYHPRADDLLELARLCNARHARPDSQFDVTRPLRLTCVDGHYWMLAGTSLANNFRFNLQWVSVRLEGQPERYRKELERCHGIEATASAEVALDRLLAVERKRATEAPEASDEEKP